MLAIEAENLPAPVTANPAGLIGTLSVKSADGAELLIASDHSWRCAGPIKWTRLEWASADFNDRDWALAKDLGVYGCKPWGEFPVPPTYGSFAAGIAGKVRVIYVPTPPAIRVAHLERDVNYRAQALNPVNGKTIDLGEVVPDKQSQWMSPKPAIESDDWVLVLTTAGTAVVPSRGAP